MEGTAPPEATVPEERPRKPRLLAWWCLLPVAGWLAVELPIGWSEAMRRASTPADAVGFEFGRLLGSAVIPLTVAWIAYRIGRRSTRAASTCFTLALALQCVLVLVGRERPTNFGEFGFEVPAGWVCVRPKSDVCKAMLLSTDAAQNSSHSVLMVDVGKPRMATARELVQHFEDSGSTPPKAIHVDGIEGFVMETSSVDWSHPRCVAAVFRDGQVYLLTAAGKDTPEITSAFGQVLKTWKWR